MESKPRTLAAEPDTQQPRDKSTATLQQGRRGDFKVRGKPSKPRILIFSHNYLPNIGGAELAIKELTSRIKDYDFVMLTAWRNRNWARHERIGSIEVQRIGFGINQLDQYLYPFIAPFKALKLYREHKFVLSWAMMPSQAGMAALAFKLLKHKVPYLLTDQSGDSEFFWGVRTWFWKPIFRQIFRRADRMQVISKFLGERAKRFGYRGEATLIPNGVDLERFGAERNQALAKALRKELGIGKQEKVLITTSRLVVKNAIEVVINAIARLTRKHEGQAASERVSYKFVVPGTGDFAENLKQLTRILKVEDKILFLGDIDNDLIPRYLGLADVFVRPSRSEGQGISFIEAMAAGVPVIATKVGGIPDFIFDQDTGLFCEVDDVKDLAEKIELITHDTELRNRIIKNAKALVREYYDWDKLAKDMQQLFSEMAGVNEK